MNNQEYREKSLNDLTKNGWKLSVNGPDEAEYWIDPETGALYEFNGARSRNEQREIERLISK